VPGQPVGQDRSGDAGTRDKDPHVPPTYLTIGKFTVSLTDR
jgi:hypothetical protein